MILNLNWEFYQYFTIIRSVIHIGDCVLYVSVQTDTISIHTEDECWTLWRSHISVGRAAFHPHLYCRVQFHGIHWYQSPGTLVLTYWVHNFRRIFQKLGIFRNGLILYQNSRSNHWERIEARSLQPLEARSRGRVLESDKERKSILIGDCTWLY
jgi:hypothetical protein